MVAAEFIHTTTLFYSFTNNSYFVLFCPVTAQLPGEDDYSGGKVIFIDTENTLYPHSAVSFLL